MPAIERYTDYDPLAWFYNRHWGRDYHPQALEILDRLVFAHLPAGARVLDLCCGTGQFTRAVSERGFQVTGIDGSEEMLRFARENAPSIDFVAADARDFRLPRPCECAFSVFESLNHVMSTGDLRLVFDHVRDALVRGGVFVFDLNRDAAFQAFWNKPYVITEDESVCVALTVYDRATEIGRCTIHMYRRNGEWTRSEAVILQKCHSIEEVRLMLDDAGFTRIRLYDAGSDLGMSGDIGFARTFFTAIRP